MHLPPSRVNEWKSLLLMLAVLGGIGGGVWVGLWAQAHPGLPAATLPAEAATMASPDEPPPPLTMAVWRGLAEGLNRVRDDYVVIRVGGTILRFFKQPDGRISVTRGPANGPIPRQRLLVFNLEHALADPAAAARINLTAQQIGALKAAGLTPGRVLTSEERTHLRLLFVAYETARSTGGTAAKIRTERLLRAAAAEFASAPLSPETLADRNEKATAILTDEQTRQLSRRLP